MSAILVSQYFSAQHEIKYTSTCQPRQISCFEPLNSQETLQRANKLMCRSTRERKKKNSARATPAQKTRGEESRWGRGLRIRPKVQAGVTCDAHVSSLRPRESPAISSSPAHRLLRPTGGAGGRARWVIAREVLDLLVAWSPSYRGHAARGTGLCSRTRWFTCSDSRPQAREAERAAGLGQASGPTYAAVQSKWDWDLGGIHTLGFKFKDILLPKKDSRKNLFFWKNRDWWKIKRFFFDRQKIVDTW